MIKNFKITIFKFSESVSKSNFDHLGQLPINLFQICSNTHQWISSLWGVWIYAQSWILMRNDAYIEVWLIFQHRVKSPSSPRAQNSNSFIFPRSPQNKDSKFITRIWFWLEIDGQLSIFQNLSLRRETHQNPIILVLDSWYKHVISWSNKMWKRCLNIFLWSPIFFTFFHISYALNISKTIGPDFYLRLTFWLIDYLI